MPYTNPQDHRKPTAYGGELHPCPRKLLLPNTEYSVFWGTSPLGNPRGNPGPGPYCLEPRGNLPGTCRRGGEEGEGKKKKEGKKRKEKREGRSIIVPPRGLRVYRSCLAQRSLYLGNLQPGREPAPARGRIQSF